MDLNSSSSEDERPAVSKGDCVILDVKQQAKKRRKAPRIGMPKKKHRKPPPSTDGVRVLSVHVPKGNAAGKMPMDEVSPRDRVRYDSEEEEALSDTESEHDDKGKEFRLQARAVLRNRRCITNPDELERFEQLTWQEQVLYKATRSRKQVKHFNIATNKGTVGNLHRSYDAPHEEDHDEDKGWKEVWPNGSPKSTSSWHDSDDGWDDVGVDGESIVDQPPKERTPLPVPPKKRKPSTESLPKRQSLDSILAKVSIPVAPPVSSTPVTTPSAPPAAPTPATPPPKAPEAAEPKKVAFASWRQRQPSAPLQPIAGSVALGRVNHGDVGMLNMAPQAPQQLPRGLVELVRPPPAWPAQPWQRVPATPRVPSRYWNRGGPVVRPSQPPRPRSPPRGRCDPRFEPRFGPGSDRRRCFDWRFDRDRWPRW